MTLYCGIDLHSNNCVVSIIDDADRVKYEKRLVNDLASVVLALTRYQGELAGVVMESTYNWYWLVDGLMAAGFDVRLPNTVAMKPYSGLKYIDDKKDSRYLADLLRLGILPEGYIYPLEQRGVRDLLRRRLLLVRQRVTQQLSLQSLIARHRGKQLSGSQASRLEPERIDELLEDAATRVSAHIAHTLMAAMSGHTRAYAFGHRHTGHRPDTRPKHRVGDGAR